MSHDDHKAPVPDTVLERLGAEFGEQTVNQLLEKALRAQVTGIGNALEASFFIDSTHGEFSVHFHLCLNPVGAQPAAADHVKH